MDFKSDFQQTYFTVNFISDTGLTLNQFFVYYQIKLSIESLEFYHYHKNDFYGDVPKEYKFYYSDFDKLGITKDEVNHGIMYALNQIETLTFNSNNDYFIIKSINKVD